MLSFLLTSKNSVRYAILKLVILLNVQVLSACASLSKSEDENVLQGTIAYPFVEQSDSLGRVPQDKIVIKTTVGAMEYQVEIPGGGDDYDIQIPISELAAAGAKGGAQGGVRRTYKIPRQRIRNYCLLSRA